MTRDAVIVSAVRTPIGKAKRGGLATVRPDDLAVAVIKELLKRTPKLDPAEIDDVVIGCAFPEGEQGMNMARMIALTCGLARFCSRRDYQPVLLVGRAGHCPCGLCHPSG